MAEKSRFVFLLDDDADGRENLDGDPVNAERQRALPGRLCREVSVTVWTVDSPGRLEATLLHTLHVCRQMRPRLYPVLGATTWWCRTPSTWPSVTTPR